MRQGAAAILAALNRHLQNARRLFAPDEVFQFAAVRADDISPCAPAILSRVSTTSFAGGRLV